MSYLQAHSQRQCSCLFCLQVNPAGVQFYQNLTNALTAAGIQVSVTLYHWDLPQSLQVGLLLCTLERSAVAESCHEGCSDCMLVMAPCLIPRGERRGMFRADSAT